MMDEMVRDSQFLQVIHQQFGKIGIQILINFSLIFILIIILVFTISGLYIVNNHEKINDEKYEVEEIKE